LFLFALHHRVDFAADKKKEKKQKVDRLKKENDKLTANIEQTARDVAYFQKVLDSLEVRKTVLSDRAPLSETLERKRSGMQHLL